MKTALIAAGEADIIRLARGLLGWSGAQGLKDCQLIILTDDAALPGVSGLNCGEVHVCVSPGLAFTEFCTESALPVLLELRKYELMVFGGIFGGELATRLAYRLGGASVTNVESVALQDDGLTIYRGVYSGNLKSRTIWKEPPSCVSLAASVCEYDNAVAVHPPCVTYEHANREPQDWMTDIRFQAANRDGNALADAKRTIAAGRGVGGKAAMETLSTLAAAMEAELGGTRAVAADGFLSPDLIIGSSGKILRADICIAFGVSGAMPFMIGVEKCGLLVAINTDPDASIFAGCDVGICGDWLSAANELLRLLECR